ncbi:unnamed protein product [Caenorhabditis auriculariae]|uniref:Protein kinase domain-containing protein n=1 Tax=Caenorhabditis auriculariae TaxID=2777116 RepID=A0A8S1HAB1_9PELO|nr:unnamed protein product [Caenorhabditis auriculariae]
MAAPGPKGAKEVIRAQKGTYEVVKAVGTGTFGSIYKVKREGDNMTFAMKCESLKLKRSLLRQASSVLAACTIQSPHFVISEERGTVPNRFLFIIYPLLGKNLVDLISETTDGKYTLPTCLHLAEQTLSAVRDLHRNGFIHRDIKPSHFCVGLEDNKTHHFVYFIDFGFCKRPKGVGEETKDDGDEEEKKLRKGVNYRGILKYASLNAHRSKPVGYKDDMESWFYMVIEFLMHGLPWNSLHKQNEKEVMGMKEFYRKEENFAKMFRQPDVAHNFHLILKSIDNVKEPSEYCDYDKIWVLIDECFTKTKSNRMAPPDWDCMTDYLGPAYKLGQVEIKAPAPPPAPAPANPEN